MSLLRRHVLHLGVCLLLLVGLLGPAYGGASPQGGEASVIVQDPLSSGAKDLVVRSGGRVIRDLPIVSGFAATVDSTTASRLQLLPGVIVTENSKIGFMSTTSTNTSTIKSAYPLETGADKLWAEGVTGKGVTVALIDTGVTEVPDLKGRLLKVKDPGNRNGQDVECVDMSGEGHCLDSYGHGTFMAGLIAGTGQLSGGRFKGMAPGAKIVSVKIAGADGSADVTKVLAAIQWVVSFREQYSIKVLNLSLGTNSKAPWDKDPLNLAVQRAWVSGIAVVVSAGNLGPNPNTISKPADDPFVITVGATDDRETPAIDDDRLPRFSSRGPAGTGPYEIPKPDVVAPGARLVSLRSPDSTIEKKFPGGGVDVVYRRGSGTSMAAAVTSGAAALMIEASKQFDNNPNRLKFALASTARKVAEREATGVGAGLIDAYAAARKAGPGVANNGATSAISSGTGSLQDSRGSVYVTRPCTPIDQALNQPCIVTGDMTAQGDEWDGASYAHETWNSDSWYESQWIQSNLNGSSWYGSSWYGSSWYGSSWYGTGCARDPNDTSCAWYGSSWYGSMDPAIWYGAWMEGSSWYGAWF